MIGCGLTKWPSCHSGDRSIRARRAPSARVPRPTHPLAMTRTSAVAGTVAA